MNVDVTRIFQDRLASSMGLDRYRDIMEQVKITNVSNDLNFQRVFNGFYMIRRNAEWRSIYYELFEQIKNETPTFSDIITYMYERTGNIEASFSSKMLATIFPDCPIWDKYILQNLKKELIGETKRERLRNAITLYAEIEGWYTDFLQTDLAQEYISSFDLAMPNYSWVSSVKKIDTILWSIR